MAAPQQPVDPTLAPVFQRLDSFEQKLTQSQQWQQQQQFQHYSGIVDAFAKDHPYLGDLEATMTELLQARVASDLEQAYQMALARTPAVRDKIEAERKAESDKAANVAKEAAAKARKIATTNVRSSGSTVEAAPGNDMNSIRATMRQAAIDAESRRAH
jgi:hypothetical protein